MPEYQERFTVGSRVKVGPREALENFRQAWHYHHPLTVEQLKYAGAVAKVKEVGFYHGGEVLYILDGIPGIWHDACLTTPTSDDVAG